MKAVDVFLRIEKRKDAVFVDLSREGKLNEDTMNFRISVQVIDQLFEGALRRAFWK